ncbi:discoidin domain-containing protein [Brevundimonas nasdae]|uniref:Discoidin domain-containing protein n=1 Tax=Brevundimonas nasdae TaxID=172043 RepID=A0ABX8TMK5_9CAUL|nr:discoidin domain-containing protein [Brevundimonas nasdae]QYC11263.1 discoidin domain-containing protein [Brevundimonas nasdae]QYC14050.1 discoidin domain-containing protein [Brevundimonas nasdae]
MRNFLLAAASVLTLALAPPPAVAQEARVLDSMDDASRWEASASTDVRAAVSAVAGHEGQAVRLDYDFDGKAGYAVLSRPLPFDLPENYEISFWVRGAGPTNTFEVKLTDASADNVWWKQTARYDFPDGWARFVIKRRQVSKAWGPSPETVLRRAERVEFVVVAADGGRGSVDIDQLSLRSLPVAPAVPPQPIASDGREDSTAANAVDLDPRTAWTPPIEDAPALTLDLGYEREFGGLTLLWSERGAAADYRVSISSDGHDWRELISVQGGNGGVDWLRTPEATARWLRLEPLRPVSASDVLSSSGAGQRLGAMQAKNYVLNATEVEPLAFGADATAFAEAVAKENRRGLYPRGLFGEQAYWTLVGVDGGGESGLISEDGAIELKRAGPSIEPFVIDNGRLITWADVNIEQVLKDGDLPIPSVTWVADGWTLKITSFADGVPEQARLWGRYDLTNTSNRLRSLTLVLTARAFQVNGPMQFLAIPGGVAPIARMNWDGAGLTLNDTVRVQPLSAPDAVAAATFDAGADPQSLILPSARHAPEQPLTVVDATELPAAALLYDITLQPGETRTFGFMSPLAGTTRTASDLAVIDQVERNLTAEWREKLDRVDLTLPPAAQRIEDALKSSLAHVLMSRQGPILQPGTRSYNRSWIRDGAMMAEGLNRLGMAEHSADYLRWYAPYVFENGKVPCCVDARGADPVPENDSHGEFIFLAAETYRYTKDEALLRQVWPQVQKAIAYMDGLRASTRMAGVQTSEQRHLYGLLPPTISHEGYSDKAAYSYWDDFWGLLGYKDAVFIAQTLGDADAAARYAAARDQFAVDIRASIIATAEHHGIDWIAGAADRGDFDATSTTIALSPAGVQDNLPAALMARTFDLYWANFQNRLTNRTAWTDYTPYEWRLVGAFVRLGQKDRALAVLNFLMADRRPEAWNGWAEVVGHEKRQPRFIGDMPHAWISSDYIRSALDLLAYERDRDHALVLAAGAPQAWLDTTEGVGVRNLRTAYGPLTYAYRKERNGYVLRLSPGASPPGGFILQWSAGDDRPARVRIDGRTAEWSGDELHITVGAKKIILN